MVFYGCVIGFLLFFIRFGDLQFKIIQTRNYLLYFYFFPHSQFHFIVIIKKIKRISFVKHLCMASCEYHENLLRYSVH